MHPRLYPFLALLVLASAGAAPMAMAAPATSPRVEPTRPAPARAVPAQAAPAGYNLADATHIASRVQAYYNQTKDFKTRFKQTYSKAYHAPEAPRYGYLWVKKPGLMRWDYSSPTKRQLICDGKKIWINVPGDKQVFWQDLQESALPVAVTFLWGKGDITSAFHVALVGDSKYASPTTIVMRLLPKQSNSNFKHVLFVVEVKTGMVSQSLIYDHLGNKNHYVFSAPVVNSGVPDSTFQFKPPPGVRVIKATEELQP